MTTASELDDRYGRSRSRRPLWIALGAVAAVVVIIAGWLTVSQAMNNVDADDAGFTVVDEHAVTVRFHVTTSQSRDVVCAVEALDEEFGIVGWRIVEIAATGTPTRTATVTIPTVSEATTGLVNSCWVA